MQRIARPRTRRWTTDRLIRFALAHGSNGRGWTAVAQLHDRGSPALLARIEALVRSASARRRAFGLDIAAQVRAAGHRHDYEREPYALEATHAMLVAALDERNVGVLRSAVMGLSHRPLPDALPALLAHLGHADSSIRFALAHALGHYPHADAAAALVRLAMDRDDDVRDWATFSLGTISDADDDAIRARLWTNAHDPNRDVRGEALVGLARRGDPRVIALLKERLDDDCRVYELEAVEEMPRPELLEPLQRLREDADRTRGIDTYWYRHLLEAIDACATMADAAA
jgi:hypothetical protein